MTQKPPQSKTFTVEEANRTLPLVKAIVGDFVALYGDLHQSRERLAALRSKQSRQRREEDDPYEQEVLQMEADLDRDIQTLQGYVDELSQVGPQVKDPFQGYVDYRTTIDGQEARLCWKPGETEIGYWHAADDECADRQSLLQGASLDHDDTPDSDDSPNPA